MARRPAHMYAGRVSGTGRENMTEALRPEALAAGEEAVHKLRHLKALGMFPLDGKFYPALMYPPINMVPAASPEDVLPDKSCSDALFNVYLHVPFCLKRCVFCEIPTCVGADQAAKEKYADAAISEMDGILSRMGVAKLGTRAILIGGGTPTAVPPELLDSLLQRFTSRLDLSKCTQISVDLDPATVLGEAGMERLHIMKKYGVSRLAFGVQSMDDGILRRMNRAHDSAGAAEAVRRSKALGFKVNAELIFGYPGDTLETWARTVTEICDLQPDEVQIYRLKIIPYREQANYLLQDYQSGRIPFPTDEDTIRMQGIGTWMLEARGYNENMRRFFTRTREDRSHQFFNWVCRLEDEIGFGHTGMSDFRGRRYQNQRDLAGYMAKYDAGESPIERGMIHDEDTRIRWAFTLPLRYFEADRELFRAKTGRDLNDVFKKKVARLRGEGLIEDHPGGIRLTRWGAFFADEMGVQFHAAKYLLFPPSAFADGPLNPHKDKEI